MSIDSKHAYRFGYLKSDKWKAVRLEALVREKGKCQICGEESIFNDAHHKWYPENIQDTTEKHLIILCRPCHEFIHAVFPECKTSNIEEGEKIWSRFYNAIMVWRLGKASIFEAIAKEDDSKPGTMRALAKAYEKLKEENQHLQTRLNQVFQGSELSHLPTKSDIASLPKSVVIIDDEAAIIRPGGMRALGKAHDELRKKFKNQQEVIAKYVALTGITIEECVPFKMSRKQEADIVVKLVTQWAQDYADRGIKNVADIDFQI